VAYFRVRFRVSRVSFRVSIGLVGLGIGSAELVWLELELGIGRAFIDSIRGACCRFCSGSAMLTVSS